MRWVFRSVSCMLLAIGLVVLCALPRPVVAQTQSLPNPFDFLADSTAFEVPSATSTDETSTDETTTVETSSVETSTDDVAVDRPVPAPAGNNPKPTGQVAEEPVEQVDEAGVEPPPDPPAIDPADQPAGGQPAAMEPDAAPPAGVDSVLQEHFERALLIEVNGPIFDRFHWYLNNRLDLAQAQQVDLVVIRLTSPGGDLEHSLQLARRLRDINWATTVAFIPEEAISGGAMIALGCDRIYMQPGALLGDAGPIRMGLGGQFEHAEEKIVSYTVSAVRELAAGQDRPPALAEAMVDRSVTVYHAVEMATGKDVFLSEKEFNEAGVAQKFELGAAVPETGQNRFLTLGAARARELQLCEGLFGSEADLLAQLSIGKLERTRLNWVDRTVFTLNRPWLTALLLIAGLIGLYLELAAPGISIAGLGSMVCFGIFFWSHALGGTAGWLEVLLFFMGIMCLAFELFVLPGFGVFGLCGLVLVVLSLVMASQNFIIPRDAAEWGEFQVNLLIVLGAVLGVLVLFFGQIVLLDSIPGLNRFRLSAPQGEIAGVQEATTGLLQSSRSPASLAPTVGATGIAESDLRPSGKVIIAERLLDVITEGDYIEAGLKVEVLRVEGNRIVVRRV